MDKYTASNGIEIAHEGARVKVKCSGGAYPDGHHLSVSETSALREFFRAERDEEAGLWRSKADPTWTALRKGVVVYFSNEDHERQFYISLKSDALIKGWSADLQAIGREYLEAHPVRKPWHDAKHGEVWVISTENVADEVAVRGCISNEVLSFEYVNHVTTRLDVTDKRIVTGRRIWPESD